MIVRRAFAVLGVLAVAACGPARHAKETAAATAPTPLIEARGVPMPLRQAVRVIGFRPFIPSAGIVEIAAIPPLGGTDRRETHGLAIEYDRSGDALLLSEWPRGAFEIAAPGGNITHHPCAPVVSSSAPQRTQLIWTTRNGLVMTLQPDGDVPASRVLREARRLAAAGCR